MENDNKHYDEHSQISMIGAINRCPAEDRDDACCYSLLLKLDMKEAVETVKHMPSYNRQALVDRCKQCSLKKQITRIEASLESI